MQVRDLGSTHGTFLNGDDKRIPEMELRELKDGDSLTFGAPVIQGTEQFAPTTVKVGFPPSLGRLSGRHGTNTFQVPEGSDDDEGSDNDYSSDDGHSFDDKPSRTRLNNPVQPLSATNRPFHAIDLSKPSPWDPIEEQRHRDVIDLTRDHFRRSGNGKPPSLSPSSSRISIQDDHHVIDLTNDSHRGHPANGEQVREFSAWSSGSGTSTKDGDSTSFIELNVNALPVSAIGRPTSLVRSPELGQRMTQAGSNLTSALNDDIPALHLQTRPPVSDAAPNAGASSTAIPDSPNPRHPAPPVTHGDGASLPNEGNQTDNQSGENDDDNNCAQSDMSMDELGEAFSEDLSDADWEEEMGSEVGEDVGHAKDNDFEDDNDEPERGEECGEDGYDSDSRNSDMDFEANASNREDDHSSDDDLLSIDSRLDGKDLTLAQLLFFAHRSFPDHIDLPPDRPQSALSAKYPEIEELSKSVTQAVEPATAAKPNEPPARSPPTIKVSTIKALLNGPSPQPSAPEPPSEPGPIQDMAARESHDRESRPSRSSYSLPCSSAEILAELEIQNTERLKIAQRAAESVKNYDYSHPVGPASIVNLPVSGPDPTAPFFLSLSGHFVSAEASSRRTHVGISDLVNCYQAPETGKLKRKADDISDDADEQEQQAATTTNGDLAAFSSNRARPQDTCAPGSSEPHRDLSPASSSGAVERNGQVPRVQDESVPVTCIPARPAKRARLMHIAERVGYAALGGVTAGAVIMGTLIYTAPTFA